MISYSRSHDAVIRVYDEAGNVRLDHDVLPFRGLWYGEQDAVSNYVLSGQTPPSVR
jgi:hypothetical protein